MTQCHTDNFILLELSEAKGAVNVHCAMDGTMPMA